MHGVYILRCGDGSLYTGWTNDLPRRLQAHPAGEGGRYTRSPPPGALAYWEPCPTPSAAMAREREIKALTRGEKLALIAETRENEEEQKP